MHSDFLKGGFDTQIKIGTVGGASPPAATWIFEN